MNIYSIIILVVILVTIILMSIIGNKSFKGILDALETNRKQIEQLLEFQGKLNAELLRQTSLVISTQEELKDAMKQLSQIGQALDELTITSSGLSIKEGNDYQSSESCNNSFPIKEEPVTQPKEFFGKAYDEPDRQIVEAKNTVNASSTMPFKVKTNGNTGTIVFNEASYEEIAKNIQVTVFPFCQVNNKVGGTPLGVENEEQGEVAFRNGEWIITKKPTIRII